MRRLHLAVLVPGLALLAACPSEQTDTTTTVVDLTQTETGDGDPGDGDPGDGDGDPGDGDPGDGDPGDGDGDPGDGDGDPCPVGTLGCACDEDDQCLDELNCNEGVCASPTCGDGVLDPGEECDVGNETMFCDEDCTYSVCGDGYWNQLSEQCDDGNSENNDACVGACLIAACGDDYVWEGMEDCDDGDMDDNNDCRNDCSMPYCGDGAIWDAGAGEEECDDGNMDETDACNGLCQNSFCGDGVVWNGMETCDDGNMDDSDACPTSCEPATCGDGFLYQGVEECDDGNNIDDDFCSNSCVSNGGVFYTGDFTQGQASQQQCADWQTFQAQLQQAGNFSFIQISGTNNPQGVSCNGAAANTICQAIANSQTVANIACDGRTWNVGPCGNGTELNAQGNGDCVCDNNPSYTLRPCINNLNWGGVNTLTCNAPSQTMEVICG